MFGEEFNSVGGIVVTGVKHLLSYPKTPNPVDDSLHDPVKIEYVHQGFVEDCVYPPTLRPGPDPPQKPLTVSTLEGGSRRLRAGSRPLNPRTRGTRRVRHLT